MQRRRRHALLDGGIQGAQEWRERLGRAEQLRIEPVARRERRFEFPEPEELLVAEVLARGVVLQVTAGHPRELLALQLAEHGAELARRDEPVQLRVRGGDALADRVERL